MCLRYYGVQPYQVQFSAFWKSLQTVQVLLNQYSPPVAMETNRNIMGCDQFPSIWHEENFCRACHSTVFAKIPDANWCTKLFWFALPNLILACLKCLAKRSSSSRSHSSASNCSGGRKSNTHKKQTSVRGGDKKVSKDWAPQHKDTTYIQTYLWCISSTRKYGWLTPLQMLWLIILWVEFREYFLIHCCGAKSVLSSDMCAASPNSKFCYIPTKSFHKQN